MNLEFQCPHCGMKMRAETNSASGIAQCPSCRGEFRVDVPQAELPSAHARVVAPHAPSPPAPHGRQPPHARPLTVAQRQAMEQAQDRKGKWLVGGLLIGGAGVIFALFQFGAGLLAEQKESVVTKPSAAKIAADDAAAKMEVVKAEAERQRKLADEQTKDIHAKEKVEEERKARDLHQRRVGAYATQLFRGDVGAAEEMVTVMEEIEADLQRVMWDGIPGNEPKNQKEYEAFVTSHLMAARKKSPVLDRLITAEFLESLTKGRRPGAVDGGKELPAALTDGTYAGTGTGFYVSESGLIVTNAHVVGDARNVDLRHADGRIESVAVLKADPEHDLALLKSATPTKAWLPVSASEQEPGLGHPVFTIGYPQLSLQGVEPKFTDGKISAQTGFRDNAGQFQISVPIQPGNSGGPLVDSTSGWVLGVIVAGLNGDRTQNVNYAIKGRTLHALLKATPEFSKDAKPMPTLPKDDLRAVTDRVKSSVILILVKSR